MKNYVVILVLVLTLNCLNAQEIFTSSGGNFKDNNSELNWTIGESITETIINGNNNSIVTSGINQPIINIQSIVQNIEYMPDISIFPNPTMQFVNIKLYKRIPLTIKVLSITGDMLYSENVDETSFQVNISNNVNGIYILEIIDKFGKINSYKIVKQ